MVFASETPKATEARFQRIPECVSTGAANVPSGAPRIGQLPFTGLGLLLFAVLGMALLLAGSGIRARVRVSA